MIDATQIPNLHANERGYATGDADWPLARVRIVPVYARPAIAGAVNGPVVSRRIVVEISCSLVDADGAVLRIGGDLMVQDGSRHVWVSGGPVALDVEAWMARVIGGEVARLLAMARDLAAAAAFGILAPAAPVTVAGAPTSAGFLAPIILSDEQAALSRPPA